ncbi:hypothetical protein E2C01_102423 [Portunus trituberculatus]|uniref:Uncharacterized protein n=1 Tax=Portunus trituberculatus TaxID=210409 RepID=A0A5B7KD45_PORTR|nr:hypothetical protein [Portunus trituberculatus]
MLKQSKPRNVILTRKQQQTTTKQNKTRRHQERITKEAEIAEDTSNFPQLESKQETTHIKKKEEEERIQKSQEIFTPAAHPIPQTTTPSSALPSPAQS